MIPDRSDARKVVNAGLERCRTGGIKDRRDAGQEEYRTEGQGLQDRKDAGQA